METTFENKFFDAFRSLGVVDGCLDWLKEQYCKPTLQGGKADAETARQQAFWQDWHDNKEPPQIEKETKAFANWFNNQWQALIAEIQANIDGCKTDAERGRYLPTLLTPFATTQRGFNPNEEINRARQEIAEAEKCLMAFKDDVAQVEACQQSIAKQKQRIERAKEDVRRFENILDNNGIVERCFAFFYGIWGQYANRLAALLLSYGIDLLRLQDETGVYLTNDIDITNVCYYYPYLGSIKLAQRDIERLQTGCKPQQADADTKNIAFSEDADTDKAIWGLLERLKNDGWITPAGGGFKWKRGVTNQLIAYWVEQVSLNFKLSNTVASNGNPAVKWQPFERLFGLKGGTLKTAKQGWLKINTKFTPKGYEKIEPYTKPQQ